MESDDEYTDNSRSPSTTPPPPPPPEHGMDAASNHGQNPHQHSHNAPPENLMEYEEEEEEDDASNQASDTEGDEEETYNLRMFGISQALPVDGEPGWDAGEPDSAEEYLRRVRFEAAACPRVVRVDISPDRLQQMEVAAGKHTVSGQVSRSATMPLTQPAPMAAAPEWASPRLAWIQQFLLDFFRLRQHVSALAQRHAAELQRTPLPPVGNAAAWERICFGPSHALGPHHHPLPVTAAALPGSGCSTATADVAARAAAGAAAAARAAAAGHAMEDEGTEGNPSGAAAFAAAASQQQFAHLSIGSPPSDHAASAGSSSIHPVTLPAGMAGGGAQMDHISGSILRTVLSLDQVSIARLLSRHISAAQSADMTYQRCQWLFALSAVLEKPLGADMAAQYRSLLRRCCSLRAAVVGPEDEALARLNTLIVISGAYFAQDEELSGLAQFDLH